MAREVIQNCIITHKDSEILKKCCVLAGSTEYHIGIDIKCDTIYSPCYGVCIYTGLIENKPSCTIQYSENICLRFLNLKEVCVLPGDIVSYNQELGIAEDYVHFEYLTSQKSYPYFRVFFNCTQSYYLYKHDPMLVLSGNTVFDNRPRLTEPAGLLTALYEDGLENNERIGWADL